MLGQNSFSHPIDKLVGKRISIPQQFAGTVLVESGEILENTVILKVKTELGEREEALLTLEEAQALEETEQQDYQPNLNPALMNRLGFRARNKNG